MPLQTANQYNLVANAAPLADRISGIVDQRRAEQKEAEALKREMLRQNLKTTGAQFLRIRDMPDINSKKKAISELARSAWKRGEDIDVYDQAMLQDNEDALNAYLIQVATRATDADKLLEKGLKLEGAKKHQQGATRFAKDEDDNIFQVSSSFDPSDASTQGLVTPIGHTNKVKGQLTLVGGTGETADEKRTSDADKNVETTQILENIKTLESIKRERAKLQAQLEKRPDIVKAERLAALDAEIAKEAFTQTRNIQQNILSLKEVVRLVQEEGAETGPISDMFPSFRAATVELENIRKELGLNVIGAVTFGALSKGEMDLAMSKALPTNLDGPELIEWANRKIAAQEKLAGYFAEQAIFLSEGGSQVEWLQHKRAQQKASQANENGLTPEEQAELDQLTKEKEQGLF